MTLDELNQLAMLCASGGSTFNFDQFNCAINVLKSANIEGKPIFRFSSSKKVFPPSTPFAENTHRRNMAYSGGAHIILTDYPVPPFAGRERLNQFTYHLGASQNTTYWAETPGGLTYRCNPLTTQNYPCSRQPLKNC